MRHRAGVLAVLATVTLLTACGLGEPLDPQSADLVARREAATRDVRDAARAAAAGLDGGDALGLRTDTRCTYGQDNWETQDPYRSRCDVTVTTAVQVRRPALRELIGVERRLNAAGWYGWASVWELTGGRGYLDRESLARGAAPYRLEDVAGALFLGASESRWDPGQLKVSFRPVDGPLPSPQAPLSDADALSYAAYTVGTDWQDAVARAPADHPYLLLVTGTVTIGVQDR